MIGPGILEAVPDAVYHADPCERPSLTRSIAHILYTQSPRHAWTAHPKLNPDWQPAPDAAHFDLGTVAHAILFGGEVRAAILDYPDWRSAAAKNDRDAARAAGQIPLLAKNWQAVEQMVAAAHQQIDDFDVAPVPFTGGVSEQTLVWEEPNGVVCRARLDWLRHDRRTIDDYKTTSRSANPDAFGRSLFGSGYDMQAAFYLRGVRALEPDAAPEFRFVAQETFPPYALSVVALAPDALAIAEAKVAMAIDKWAECLAANSWPAYPLQVAYVEAPPWEEARLLERTAA